MREDFYPGLLIEARDTFILNSMHHEMWMRFEPGDIVVVASIKEDRRGGSNDFAILYSQEGTFWEYHTMHVWDDDWRKLEENYKS